MMRREVVFPSRGLDCKGWLFLPAGLETGQTLPAIAMAHGLSGVKEMSLAGFAERFAAAYLEEQMRPLVDEITSEPFGYPLYIPLDGKVLLART